MGNSQGITDLRCNILMMGKSGAGKSSFCNYLFEKPNFFTTGKGEPVTSWEENFQSFDFKTNGITIEVFDTVGIEVDNYIKWKKELDRFLLEHSSTQKNVSDWLHGIFYIINASSDRFEDVERDLITSLTSGSYINNFDLKKIILPTLLASLNIPKFTTKKNILDTILQTYLSREISPPIQIVLTNCDTATENQIQAIIKELRLIKSDLIIHQVNSVTQRFRNKSTEAFGRDNVLDSFLNQAYTFINKSLSLRALDLIQVTFKNIQNEINTTIDNFSISLFNLGSIEVLLDESLNNLEEKIDSLLDKSLAPIEEYEELLESFEIHYKGIDYFTIVESAIVSDLDTLPSKLFNKLETALEKLESGNFTEKVGAAITLGFNVIRAKKTLKTIIDETFESLNSDLNKARIEINN